MSTAALARPANTVHDLLAGAERRLAGHTPSPRLDAELLLAESMGCNRTRLFVDREAMPAATAQSRFATLLDARMGGTPVAYLLGRREFWSLTLAVTPDTLIPRPETEVLVQTALDLIAPSMPATVVDLGTGSGAIALALASARPTTRVVATDASAAALAVAVGNARALNLDVEFLCGDWYEPLDGRCFDLIVSNPPYVAAGDVHLNEGDLRHEPPLALIGGDDGFAALDAIADGAADHLLTDGWLLLEHGAAQGLPVRNRLGLNGYREVRTIRDLAGLERVTLARRPVA
jgi:release factor glutamine methyltransferase